MPQDHPELQNPGALNHTPMLSIRNALNEEGIATLNPKSESQAEGTLLEMPLLALPLHDPASGYWVVEPRVRRELGSIAP